jgi:tetratricopeptide (TPR) repeat protein
LNTRLAELYQKGDLDAAIPLAEEIVALERRTSPVSDRNLTNALENLAQLKFDRVKRSMAELRDPRMDQEKAKPIFVRLRKDAAETETHFREAIDLAGSSTANVEQAINLRSKLAWLSYNYIPADTNPTFGFDKDSRDKLELRQRAIYVQRFDESRKRYSEAREIAERSTNDAVLLRANFSLAEFETAMGNFEAAIPLYERIISDAERLLPRRSPELVAPYEAYLKVLVATGQEDKAYDLLSKIVR